MIDTQSGQVVTQVVTSDSSLSLGQLFWGADFLVQLIIVGLLLTSFFSWAIIFNKSTSIKKLHQKSKKMEKEFWHADSLSAFQKRARDNEKDPVVRLFALGYEETQRFSETYANPTSQDLVLLEKRLHRLMSTYLSGFMAKTTSHIQFLATVGSATPFVGLFGTVWGIMHSFQSIAGTKNTSLAVVAPGIAEALFATALGLVAAIPAVIAYNKLSAMANQYAAELDSFMDELISLLQQHAMKR